MVRARCTATNKQGEACKAFALPGETLCFSHHPEKASEVKEAQRRGGVNRSNARRAAKTLAMTGRQVRDDELPALVKACILRVISGQIEPSVATAVAQLARTSLQLSHDLSLEQRIVALEEATGTMPANVRRIA